MILVAAFTLLFTLALPQSMPCAFAKDQPYNSSENAFVLALAREAIAKGVNTPTSANRCELPIIEARDFQTLTKKRPEQSIRDRNGQTQRLSVLSPEEARLLQTYIAAQDHLAFGFTESGCVQRAVEIHRILRTQGIEAGIIQAFGDEFGEGEGIRVDSPPAPAETVWKFHTAAVVMTRENGKSIVRVLDPSLSSKLLTKAEWLRELKKRSTNETPIQADFASVEEETTPSRVARANLTLKIYGEAQRQREEFLKNRPRQ
jgi:hypothetical protein